MNDFIECSGEQCTRIFNLCGNSCINGNQDLRLIDVSLQWKTGKLWIHIHKGKIMNHTYIDYTRFNVSLFLNC